MRLRDRQSTGLPDDEETITSHVTSTDGPIGTGATKPSNAGGGTSTSLPASRTSAAVQRAPSTSGKQSASQILASSTGTPTDHDDGSSTDSVSKTPIIVGIVVGVVLVLLIGWFTWFCVRRRKKKSSASEKAKRLEREQCLPPTGSTKPGQGLGVYGGTSSSDSKGEKTPLSLIFVMDERNMRQTHVVITTPQTHGANGNAHAATDTMPDDYYSTANMPPSHAGDEQPTSGSSFGEAGNNGARRFPYSPQSLLHPSNPEGSLPSSQSSPNNYGHFPAGASPALLSELSGESCPTPELSPNPDRLQINHSSPCPSNYSTMPKQDSDSRRPNPSENLRMQPNLVTSGDNLDRRGGHVMSWMSYGESAAGPTR
ncbi:MAG: hypothetical protein Q9179_005071 [Wetmoreana sp. 5 TL-2023]